MDYCATYSHLSIQERLVIQLRLREHDSPEQIAGLLGRSPSSVRREISRNNSPVGYHASHAHQRALRRRGARQYWMEEHPSEAQVIISFMEKHRSAAQAIKLAEVQLGYELCAPKSIYRWLRRCKSPTALYAKTLTVRYRPKSKGRGKRGNRGMIPGIVGIEHRPFDFLDRSEFGHWEGDLIISGKGFGASALITLVERTSRYTLTRKVHSRTADVVNEVLISMIKDLPAGAMLSLTWDRGRELMRHDVLTKKTGVPVFFCKPKAPWQRGSNENTNGVLRRLFPKGTNFAAVTHQMVRAAQNWLNTRPMPVLSWATPHDVFTGKVRALQV